MRWLCFIHGLSCRLWQLCAAHLCTMGSWGIGAKQLSLFPESAPLWTTHCMHMQIWPGGWDDDSVKHCAVSKAHYTKWSKRCRKKKRAVHLGHKTQSPNTLSVWTRISKSYTHQRGWQDRSHSNLEKARLCFTTVTLSQYYWGQPQWCCQPSHVHIVCMYMQTWGHTFSVGFSFTNHPSRLINHTAPSDPWCNLLITAVWVQLTDF